MKIYILRTGLKNAKTGTLTAFTLKKERVHITAKTLEDAGLPADILNKEGRLTKTLYAIAKVVDITPRDADGNLQEEGSVATVPVLTAMAVSDDRKVITSAFNEEELTLEESRIDLIQSKKEMRKAAGLDAEDIKAMLEEAVGIDL